MSKKVPPVPPILTGPNQDTDADKTKLGVAVAPLDARGRATGAKQAATGSFFSAEDDEQAVEERMAFEKLMQMRKARRRKRIIGGCVAAALVAAYGIYLALSHPKVDTSGLDVQTITVVREDFVDAIDGTGKAQPLSSTVVAPEVDGIISAVNVHEGDFVNKGDTLMSITNPDLDRAVNDAAVALKQAQLSLKQAEAAYAAAEKSNAQASSAAAQAAAGLAEGGAGADGAGADAAALLGQPQDLTSLAGEIETAKLAVDQAQDAYDQAQATANKRNVVAPVSGTLVVMNAKVGENLGQSAAAAAGASGSLMEISDLTQMTVRIQVNEADISKVHVDQKATVSFAALPDVEAEATVTRISSVSSTGTAQDMSYGGMTPVTYDVDLLIPQPVAGLKPGMTASVSIVMQEVPNALTVPASAVAMDAPDAYYVMRKTSFDEKNGTMKFEKVPVKILAQTSSVYALEGLNEGDEIALDPYSAPGAEDEVASDGSPTGDTAPDTSVEASTSAAGAPDAATNAATSAATASATEAA